MHRLFISNLNGILWCTGWSAVGIGLGLWNDRENDTDRVKEHLHYITYFIFVWFIASLAGFSVFENGLRSYAVSALTGIAIGFTGDSLAGLLLDLSKK